MDIAFPLHYDSRGQTAASQREDHVRELIEQLVFTSPGERVNRADFGSGVMQTVFGPNSPEMAAALQVTLQASLNRWLGDLIQLRTLTVDSVDSTLAVSLTYLLRDSGQVQSAVLTRSI